MTCLLTLFPLIWAINVVAAENTSYGNSTVDQVITKHINITHEESEFPEDLFTEEQRRHGAIILHCILAVYCFVAIATVCTEYFMPTIACICKALKLSDDVAAATFMSIATSSPELFTNIIGTFITNSDIGVGHVLGNAYYDMFFVAALGGLAASKEIILDWWAISRDCLFYLVVASTLTAIVWDGQVEIYETLILLFLYIMYFVVMFGNRAIIRFLNNRFNLNIIDPVQEIRPDECTDTTLQAGDEPQGYTVVPTIVPVGEKPQPLLPTSQPHNPSTPSKGYRKALKILGKTLVFPLRILTAMTIPDVRKRHLRKFYPVSFVVCVGWIGVSTYLGTWMISVIGRTIGVPDIIMGMVFMAAGGSVVEAYGVYYKARRGECSIGLSNSMGCNTLDATMCLALPWLVKSLLYTGTGSSATILASEVLHVNCILLVISVLVIYMLLYFYKFSLNWKLGTCSGFAYIAVLVIAITVESNFGNSDS